MEDCWSGVKRKDKDQLAVVGTQHLAVLVKAPNERAELRDVSGSQPVKEGEKGAEIGQEGVFCEEHIGVFLSLLPLPHSVQHLHLIRGNRPSEQHFGCQTNCEAPPA